jgi:hypothetical protein
MLKRFFSFFAAPAQQDTSAYWVSVCCNRCGEVIRSRIDLRNDLSVEYQDGATTYFCRKILMGEGRCFQRIEVELTFDANHRLVNREISGGRYVDAEEK